VRRSNLRAIVALAALCMPLLVRPVQIAAAQGVASGSIRGTVRSPDGIGLDGASVRIVNTATGFTVHGVNSGPQEVRATSGDLQVAFRAFAVAPRRT
jgi:hypothetical protein